MINTKQAFDRAQQLLKIASGTQRDFDVTQAAYRQARRAARRGAARGSTAASSSSPVAGVIQQIYFRPGETVPAEPPDHGRAAARQYQGALLRSRTRCWRASRSATRCGVTCDGCPNDITAPVTFISRNAEFTPPVIYSLEERSKLVYLVEARPAQTEMLRVGQPVDVDVKLREAPK